MTHHPYLMQSRIPTSAMAPDDDKGGGGADPGAGGGADPGGGGDPPPDWFAPLPDDLKSQTTVTRHKSLADFANAAVAAEKRLGVPADQLLRLPTNDEEMATFTKDVFKRLGAPDTPEGYQIAWEGATDDDKAMIGKFAKHMHEAGAFPPAALQAAAAFWQAETAAAAAAEQQAEAERTAAGEAALKSEWGAAYEAKTKEIGKLLTELGGKDLLDELDETKLGSSPHLARLLAKVVDLRAEPGPSGDAKNALPDGAMTPGQAKEARAALEGDPKKMRALTDASDPMHASVLAERRRYLAWENGRKPEG
jgi:hypothetical protein